MDYKDDYVEEIPADGSGHDNDSSGGENIRGKLMVAFMCLLGMI